MESWDETNVTEIEICPDGRIHVFGASQEMMAMLQSFGWQDDRARRLQDRASASDVQEVARQEVVCRSVTHRETP